MLGAALGCFFVLIGLHTALAGWLYMPEKWGVLTVYTDPVTGQEQDVVWEYAVDRKAGLLSVTAAGGTLDLEVEAVLNEEGFLTRLSETRKVGQRKLSSSREVQQSRPQVMTQGMVPLSLLHVQELQDTDFPVEVTEVTSAGGAVFATTYQLDRQELSLERAREERLLHAEQSSLIGAGPLLDYTLRDQDGTLVLRQVWNEELSFWLHEATPNRKSWLLSTDG